MRIYGVWDNYALAIEVNDDDNVILMLFTNGKFDRAVRVDKEEVMQKIEKHISYMVRDSDVVKELIEKYFMQKSVNGNEGGESYEYL